MPLTIFSDKVRFCYKSKNWQRQVDEIEELGLLYKKKAYLINGFIIALTAVAYYYLLFSVTISSS